MQRIMMSFLLPVLCIGVYPVLANADAPKKKINYKDLSIPRSHPRLWWNKERLQRAKQWLANNRIRPRPAIDHAFLYVVTGEKKYARTAIDKLMGFKIPEERLRQVSVDLYRWADWVPIVFDWTHDAMTAEQRKTFITRYNHYVDVIRKKPWGGPRMPGSNYYWGYLRNELNWAIATYHENPQAKAFLEHALVVRWRKAFLPFASGPTRGGVPPEGSQYGRYMLQYPVVPFSSLRQYGVDIFNETNFFREAVYYLIHASTPQATNVKGGSKSYHQIFPFADDEMDGGYPSAALFYYGDFMTAAAEQWQDEAAGPYARQWLAMVRPKASHFVAAADQGGKARDFASLPVDYYAPGPQFLFSRNRWGTDATCLFLQLGQAKGGSHQHHDSGSFQIWRNGFFLSKETTGYSNRFFDTTSSGTKAHNCILFNGIGHANAYADGPPRTLRVESAEHYSYAAVDLSKAYRARRSSRRQRDDNPYAASIIREFIFVKPLETLVILDRLRSTSEKGSAQRVEKTFLVHFPEKPTIGESPVVIGKNGSQVLRVETLWPKNANWKVIDEGNVKDKKLALSYRQFRAEASQKGAQDSYFIHVLQARDQEGTDIKAEIKDQRTSWLISLKHPKRGQVAIELNKGMSSRGGKIGFSSTNAPEKLNSLYTKIQKTTVNEQGPVWEAVKK